VFSEQKTGFDSYDEWCAGGGCPLVLTLVGLRRLCDRREESTAFLDASAALRAVADWMSEEDGLAGDVEVDGVAGAFGEHENLAGLETDELTDGQGAGRQAEVGDEASCIPLSLTAVSRFSPRLLLTRSILAKASRAASSKGTNNMSGSPKVRV
jgi:hypothetical protein